MCDSEGSNNTGLWCACYQAPSVGAQNEPKSLPPERSLVSKHTKLENVAIANALQLEAARRRAVPIRFNFVARSSLKSLNLSTGILAFSLLIRYVTLWPWPLTFDLEPSWCIAVTWWNSVPNLSAIEQSAAKLLRFEYLTLWPWTRVACSTMLWESLHKV